MQECSCHNDCFVWTDGTPNDYMTAWRPTEPDDGHGPGECSPEPGTPTPCHDDDTALRDLGVVGFTCAYWMGTPPGGNLGRDHGVDCPVPDGSRPLQSDGTMSNCGALAGIANNPTTRHGVVYDPAYSVSFPPIVCSDYLDNPACTCSCPPPPEDCTVLKDVLTRPDLGWADTICSLEKPYLCRICDQTEKGSGH